MFKQDKKRVFALLGLLFLASSLTASEKSINLIKSENGANWRGMVKLNQQVKHSGKNSFELHGKYPTELIYADYIPIAMNRSYTLSAWMRSLDDKLPASAHLGLRLYNKDKQEIKMIHIGAFAGTESSLTAPAEKGATELLIKKNPKCLEIVTAVLVLNIKNDYKDLPNFDYSSRIKKIINEKNNYRVILTAPLTKNYPKGTRVRQHTPWGAPLYSLVEGWIPAKWTKFSATIAGVSGFGVTKDKFWHGTKYVKPFIWFGNWNRKPKKGAVLLVDEVKFIVQ